ncbi:non-heme iron oxygenase ferredoxin subunit [Pseudonocardia thermophila]|uniref:non-heme iron oxygenase ferredoxin subunit n=1 Tax=Pseudonocardia thermophila TaxID=1848 RepID=UPI00248E7CA8|nr:non-heme iron oxygenase ferredoxin subunit [Pseudonocardia thermophila]
MSDLRTNSVVVCALDDVPPGTSRRVVLDHVEPLAVHNVNGTIRVTSDTCTHADASLSEGYLEGSAVVCPLHFAEFDVVTGRALCLPAELALTVYPARVVDGHIVVELAGEATPESSG